MNIQELKLKSSEQLITQGRTGIENASIKKTRNTFCYFKKSSGKRGNYRCGVLQLLQDGFGFL